MFYKYLYLLFILCVSWFRLYGNSSQISDISFIEIRKYSDDVHISGTYDCDEFHKFYQFFSLAGVHTIDIKIKDKSVLDKFSNTFKQYNQLTNAEVCNGWPRIKITFVFDNGKKLIFFLEGFGSRFRILNKKDKPDIKDEELIEYLHDLGGFR